jgi:predicted nucleic acid-binding protein
MVIGAGMMMATLVVAEMEQVVDTASKFSLDFDDAYQYVVAEK